MTVLDADAADLLALTAALVDVPSESHHEDAIADAVAERLAARAPELRLDRVGNNVVARTHAGRDRRVVLAGHLDTVPAAGNDRAVVEGDRLSGVGSADMKGGLAVMLRIAEEVAASSRFDLTLCFYEAEEVADVDNGMRRLFAQRPDLVAGDLAVLLEPTDAIAEAGCQGTLRVRATFRGARAHTARPWMGENAIHKAGRSLARIEAFGTPTVTVDGLEYREALQAVGIEGGVAANVVPDECVLVVNRRFAPSRSIEQAIGEVREILDGADEVDVLDVADAAAPNLSHPLLGALVERLGVDVRPKLGWTDVARFTSHGIPALNFGPGAAEVAHTPGEFVTRDSLERCYAGLAAFLLDNT